MSCEMTSTHIHRKTHSLSFPRETIPLLNYFISLTIPLPIPAPSKHLHQYSVALKASLDLNVNVRLLVYYCNGTGYEIDLLLHTLRFFQKNFVNILREMMTQKTHRGGEEDRLANSFSVWYLWESGSTQ